MNQGEESEKVKDGTFSGDSNSFISNSTRAIKRLRETVQPFKIRWPLFSIDFKRRQSKTVLNIQALNLITLDGGHIKLVSYFFFFFFFSSFYFYFDIFMCIIILFGITCRPLDWKNRAEARQNHLAHLFNRNQMKHDYSHGFNWHSV